MKSERKPSDRDLSTARIMRALGTQVMSKDQAQSAAQSLGVHWTTVYRLRKRFLADPVTSSVMPRKAGPAAGSHRLVPEVDGLITATFKKWDLRQHAPGETLNDLTTEVRRVCDKEGLPPPSRHTVARRWALHKQTQDFQSAKDPGALMETAYLGSKISFECVQIEHLQADVILVDELLRKPIGRPWVSLAVDVATRCVVAVNVAMERPNAETVGLLLTRVVLPKNEWLKSIGLDLDWPMHGIPKSLFLKNAGEFKSKALRTACAQYDIDLTYQPVAKLNSGGPVGDIHRALIDGLRGMSADNSKSKAIKSKTSGHVKSAGKTIKSLKKYAALTLPEFEKKLVLDIAQRYHHSGHDGLMGTTPSSVWQANVTKATKATKTDKPAAIRTLPGDAVQELRFLVQFLPTLNRTIQPDGLTLFYINYWHPTFAAWRESRKQVIVRYHPEDLSRVFVSANGKDYVEAAYADAARPRISLPEQRAAIQNLRLQGQTDVSEELIFKAVARQRELIAKSRAKIMA